jgi:hypothetical protein
VAYLRLAWQRFSTIAKVFGSMQARVIASVLYFTIILPFGLLMQTTDHVFKNTDRNAPTWAKREPVEHTLDAAKRQG